MIKLRLSGSMFTTAYRKLRAAIQKATRFVIFFGAADSSKSYSAHQDLVLDLMTAKDDILVVRKNSAHIRESCYKLLKSIIVAWGLASSFDFFYSSDKREIVYKETGRKIAFTGINDPESLKSIFGFYRLLIEEANQLDWEDFLELNRRLRSNQSIQIIMLLNPVSEQHWIKARLIDNPAYSGDVTSCHVTYHDNEYITRERVAELERLKEVDEYQYRVYVLGLWGIIKPENPFFHKIDPNRHFGKVIYDPKLPVYLAFDFNKVNSVTVRQKQPGKSGGLVPRFLKEIHKGGEGADLEEICKELSFDYGRNMILVTGDASGNQGRSETKGNRTAWMLIKGYFRDNNVSFINYDAVPSSNPSHTESRFVCNALVHHWKDDFLIDRDNCPTLCADVIKMKTNTDGGLDKKDCDKYNYGHVGDCGRYDLCNFEYTTFKNLGHYQKKAA
ncbi:PBSX family phage terminase large subunit [Spirosoma oryzicola]|uniref:PBSX family phage terminase large subunit n=1 Tax=Spirosoma oryzicola TaxID=2898794 RepID=UPI001E5C8883|nr:PBSX family phage terminase large subunit [Spirosoma oryzicola]UHG93224.1 PBSX family phage terminase large subunit [Spirosoma oryzicola]